MAGDGADDKARHRLPADLTGADALAGAGGWETAGGYGAVWFPASVPDGWAPYRDGHWRWIARWGWTWIDELAWGFATSHYGRWAAFPGAEGDSPRWGWVPGDAAAGATFAPAVVAFLGTEGVGLSYADASGPAVAWFPLAPGEVYWPRYIDDPETIRHLNPGMAADLSQDAAAADGAPPAIIINGAYQNRRFASVVPRAVFLAGRPVMPALLQIPDRRLDNAPLLAGSPGLAPTPSRPAATAVAVAAVPAKVARAMHTLARILRPRGHAKPVRVVVAARARHMPAAAIAVGGHWRAPRLRLVRHAATLTAAPGPRLRLAAAHRRKGR